MISAAFFMLVTPHDYEIARYTISSFARVLERDERVRLVVYCNGLDPAMERRIAERARRHDRITIASNAEAMGKVRHAIALGELYRDADGRVYLREGLCENFGDVWTREIPKLDDDFVGLVDADFEVLDPSFVGPMLDELVADPSLAFYSSDFSETHRGFERYSRRHAMLQQRYHTWFCIYRRAALDVCCDFTALDVVKDGELCLYDNAAKMQEILIEEHGFRGRVLQGGKHRYYFHYGAFSKNTRLHGVTLSAYRFVRIGAQNGWRHTHRSRLLSPIVWRLCHTAFRALRLSRFDEQRQRFLWDQ